MTATTGTTGTRLKLAALVLSLVILVSEHVAPLPPHAPVQLSNWYSASAVAVQVLLPPDATEVAEQAALPPAPAVAETE